MKIIEKKIKNNENEENERLKNKNIANNLTNSLILSRLLYLICLFKYKNKNLSPNEFLIYQLNGNSKYANSF